MTKLEQLQDRVRQDYDKVIRELKEEQEIVGGDIRVFYICRAYEIAHYNEIDDVVCGCMTEEDEWFDEDEIDYALNYDGNLVKLIWNNWLNYRHPENYNFFTFEGIIDVLRDTFRGLRG